MRLRGTGRDFWQIPTRLVERLRPDMLSIYTDAMPSRPLVKVTSQALVQPTSHDEGGRGKNSSAFAQLGSERVDFALQGRIAHRERVDFALQGRIAHRERVDFALQGRIAHSERVDFALQGRIAHRKFQTLVDFGTVSPFVAPVTSQ